MHRTITAALIAAAALSLGACGKKADQNMPNAQENAALANTAAMDTSPDSLVATGNATLGNGEDLDEEEDVGNGA